jgi:hypothetical protein
MNPTTLTLVFSLVTLFAQIGTMSYAKESKWRQIVLLRSTRDDVERLLGRPQYEGYYTSFKVEDGMLGVEYYPLDFCTSQDGYLKVRRWTVVEMTYEPDNPPSLANLKLDLKKFRKTRESPDAPDLITYINDESGVAYTFQADGTLSDVRYFPAKRYAALRCNQARR